jgi:hypothetical protein
LQGDLNALEQDLLRVHPIRNHEKWPNCLLLIGGELFCEALFQSLRQFHDPVNERVQLPYIFRIHPALVQPLDQPQFPGVPVSRRPPRLQGLEVGQHHGGERVRVGLRGLPSRCVVQQPDNGKLHAGVEAPAAIAILARPPGGVVVSQDGQADHLLIITVKDAVIIHMHPLGEVALLPGLHLHVDQQPPLLLAREPDLDQLIHGAPPVFGLAHDRLQFLVEYLIVAGPVDVGVGMGEEEGQAPLEASVERLLRRLSASFDGLSESVAGLRDALPWPAVR